VSSRHGQSDTKICQFQQPVLREDTDLATVVIPWY